MADYTAYEPVEDDLVIRATFGVDARVGMTTDQLWQIAEKLLKEECREVRRLEDYPSGSSIPELQIACRRVGDDESTNRFLYVSKAVAELHIPEEELYVRDVHEDARRLVAITRWATRILRELGGCSFAVGRDPERCTSFDPDDDSSLRAVLLKCAIEAHQEMDSDLETPSTRYSESLTRAMGSSA